MSLLLPLLLSASAVTPAQIDPPHDGTYRTWRDQVVTYTDYYRTYMDVRIPNPAPGPPGWPLLVIVHGTGTSRARVEYYAEALAERGFVTVSYDVRGQGPGMTLNDPRFYGREIMGVRERLDLFEIIEEVELRWPDEIDLDRVGVTGKSQGGLHAWFAAAHGGKPLPPNPWRTAPLPEIAAVAPVNFGTQYLESTMPEARAFSELNARHFYMPEAQSGIHNNPSVYAFIEPYLVTEDYGGLAFELYNPDLDLHLLLPDSEVAVYASMVYDDKYGAFNRLVGDWESLLKPGTPKFLNLTTGGHSTPNNFAEEEALEYRRLKFFEHYLKGYDHGVDAWAPVRLAVTPVAVGEYNDPEHVWSVIESDRFPVDGVQPLRLYFAPHDTLTPVPPHKPVQRTIRHRTQGATLEDYLNHLPTPEHLSQVIPLRTAEFVSDPLPEGALLVGAPRVRVNAASAEQEYQLNVSLFVHDTDRYLASGFTTVRDNKVPRERSFEIELSTLTTWIPAGARIRVQVENLCWHRPPGQQSHLLALPVFSDFDAHLRVGGQGAAYIELPQLTLDEPLLASSEPYFARYPQNDLLLQVRSYANQPGAFYQVLASYTGSEPASNIFGVQVPLVADALTDQILAAPETLPISGFQGTLDARGEAQAIVRFTQFSKIPAMEALWFCVVTATPDLADVRVSAPLQLPQTE